MAHGGSSSSPPSRRRFTAAVFAVAVALALAPQLRPAAGRPDKETREKFYGRLVTNGTHNASAEDSIADMFGRVLEKEFSDSDTNESTMPRSAPLALAPLDLRRPRRILFSAIASFFFQQRWCKGDLDHMSFNYYWQHDFTLHFFFIR